MERYEKCIMVGIIAYLLFVYLLQGKLEVQSALNMRENVAKREELLYNEYDNETQTMRQTFYSKEEGETQVGYASKTIDDDRIDLRDNVYHFNDSEFGWLPIIAVNIDKVLSSGLNEQGTYNKFGSVYTLEYPSGEVTLAIALDSCGACSRDAKVDLWVETDDYKLDIEGVKVTRVRYGF